MKSIGQGGRTILFVSHNMAAVRSICDRGIILEEGRLADQGETGFVVDRYLSRSAARDVMSEDVETPSFIVANVMVQPVSGEVIKTFSPVKISVSFKAKSDIVDPGIYVALLSSEQQRLAGLDFKDFRTIPMIPAGQACEIGFVVDSLPLLPGIYQLEVHLKDMSSHKVEVVPRTFQFEIAETPIYGGRKLDGWFGHFGLHAHPFVNLSPVVETSAAANYSLETLP
jgi:lipopolysaccharide transport system ATP-binding protein